MRELGIGVPVEAQDEMRSMTFEMAFGFEAGQGRAGQGRAGQGRAGQPKGSEMGFQEI
jgi:hypothetical protein